MEKTVNEQLEAEVMTRSSTESKTSLAIAANLSELELKKILIEKMESNKSINQSNEQNNLYKALVEAYESDKLILDTYGDIVSFKRRRDDEDKDEEPSAGSNRGFKKRRDGNKSRVNSALRKRDPKEYWQDLEEPAHQEFNIGATKEQSDEETSQHPDWFQKPAKIPTPDHDWNKTLPAGGCYGPVHLFNAIWLGEEGPRISLMSLMDTSSRTFLAFHGLNRLNIDTFNTELLAGPTFELMKVIPFDHFINNDLAYLSGGVSSRTYATSVTKTKAADYGHIKWIEDLVPNTIWSKCRSTYGQACTMRIFIGETTSKIHGFAANRESAHDVYSKHDDKLYTFKEGDFKRLRRQDIEDMLILLIQGKLTNLNLGVESYQKKLNITKPDTYRFDLKRRDAYTAYSNPRGFIYQNKDKKNKLMLIDELHKFSDGTLDDVRTALNDRLKGIRMEYLPKTIWRQSDRERAKAMIQAIDKQLKSRRIMRSLKKFVGGDSRDIKVLPTLGAADSRVQRSHSRQDKEQAQDLKSMITTSNHKLMIEVKVYEHKNKVEA
ncbi:hypothetical protein Tco_0251278 [Tanacetum coccineum]